MAVTTNGVFTVRCGVILLEKFTGPVELAPENVAQELGLNPAQFTSITQSAQDTTAEVATLLAQRFGLSGRTFR
ncbi:hypothetical protein ACHABQ_11055 [Nesterenkonia aurantiaca]|uniref:hypothetical protein n=1 Tax=Nesterenkonia aurantiaca TaxID=1436010 RepID=UPI003EE7E145